MFTLNIYYSTENTCTPLKKVYEFTNKKLKGSYKDV